MEAKGGSTGSQQRKMGGLGGRRVFVCVCAGGCHRSFLWAPPFSPSCPQVCPYSYCTSELQQDRRPQKSGSKQCLPPFVSRLPFFFCPPSQSTGLLCIDFPHSAARQPLSAVFCPFFVRHLPRRTLHSSANLPLAFSAVWECSAPLDGMQLIKDT